MARGIRIEFGLRFGVEGKAKAVASRMSHRKSCKYHTFKTPQIPSNRDHKALNRGTEGGLGSVKCCMILSGLGTCFPNLDQLSSA